MLDTRLGTVAVAIAALLVGALAAAVTMDDAGPGSASGELNLVAHSATAAHEAGTARAEFEMRMEAAGLPGSGLRMTGDGAFDFAAPAGRMTMRMAADSPMPSFDMEILVTGTTFYLRAPDMGFPTEWVSFDASELGLGDVLGSGAGSDPTQSLEYLRGAAESVATVGTEDVRGVATTHYRAVVNLERAAAAAPPEQRAFLEQGIDQLREMGASLDLPVDVWIDADGLPRRMVYAMDLAIPEAGQVSLDLSMDLFDYGKPVDLTPPAPGSVTDVTDMVTGGGVLTS